MIAIKLTTVRIRKIKYNTSCSLLCKHFAGHFKLVSIKIKLLQKESEQQSLQSAVFENRGRLFRTVGKLINNHFSYETSFDYTHFEEAWFESQKTSLVFYDT